MGVFASKKGQIYLSKVPFPNPLLNWNGSVFLLLLVMTAPFQPSQYMSGSAIECVTQQKLSWIDFICYGYVVHLVPCDNVFSHDRTQTPRNYLLGYVMWWVAWCACRSVNQNYPLTQNYYLRKNTFWNKYIWNIKSFLRNSLKMSSFLGDFEGAKPLKNYEESFSGSFFRNHFVSEGTIATQIYIDRQKYCRLCGM